MAAPTLKISFANGNEEIVKINMRDQLQWENTARARHWAVDAGVKSSMFMGWHALKRTGVYTDSWQQFSEIDCDWVEEYEPEETAEDAETDLEVDESFPTSPAN